MDLSLANFFFSIAGVIIVMLIGIIGYFLKQWFESISKRWIESTSALTEAVNQLKTAVALLQLNQGNADKSCVLKHEVIDKRLNDHSKRLNDHDKELSRIDTLIGK